MKRVQYLYLFVLVIMVGCVKDIDLDQIDDIEIFTDHNIALVHFDLDVLNFLDEFSNESRIFSDTTRIPIFAGGYNQNFLIQADFEYVLNNSFDRNVLMQIELLDIIDNSLLKFDPIFIPGGTIDLPVVQIIPENEIPVVLATDKVVIKFTMSSGGIPLDPIQNDKFNLKSALVLHYKMTVEDE